MKTIKELGIFDTWIPVIRIAGPDNTWYDEGGIISGYDICKLVDAENPKIVSVWFGNDNGTCQLIPSKPYWWPDALYPKGIHANETVKSKMESMFPGTRHWVDYNITGSMVPLRWGMPAWCICWDYGKPGPHINNIRLVIGSRTVNGISKYISLTGSEICHSDYAEPIETDNWPTEWHPKYVPWVIAKEHGVERRPGEVINQKMLKRRLEQK